MTDRSMTAPTALDALASRVEAATGVDRELDAAISTCVDGDNWTDVPLQWTTAEELPTYTASLDAAMTLIPANALWYVNHDGVGSTGSVCLVRDDGSLIHGACPTIEGNTPALALCAAALRARARTQETTDVE